MSFSTNISGFNYLNSLVPGVIIARVDFDGTSYTVNTPFADTNIDPSLRNKTTAQLLELTGSKGYFSGDNGSIYRKAGAAGSTAIKIAKVVTTSIIGAHIEVVTGLTSSARNISVGTSGNTQAVIGNQLTSALGTANTIVTNTYPASGTFPTRASSVGNAAVFFNPDVLIAGGTDIILTLDASATTVIEAGSIDVHIRFGSVAISSRPVSRENLNSRGIRFGSVIPIF